MSAFSSAALAICLILSAAQAGAAHPGPDKAGADKVGTDKDKGKTKEKYKGEIVSVLDMYRCGHKLGEIENGILMDIVTADEAEKMAVEAATLFSRACDPPLEIRVVMPMDKGRVVLATSSSHLWFKPGLDVPPVGVRGTKKGEERKGFDVASQARPAGFALGMAQRLTRDKTRRPLTEEALMKELTYACIRYAATSVRRLAEHPALADVGETGKKLQDTFNDLNKDLAYKKHRVAEFRGLVDEADAQVRAALKNFPPPLPK